MNERQASWIVGEDAISTFRSSDIHHPTSTELGAKFPRWTSRDGKGADMKRTAMRDRAKEGYKF